MLGPLISILIILLVGNLLFNKFNPQAVLIISGLGMLAIAFWINATPVTLKQPTGSNFFDFFALLKEMSSKTNMGVGLMIMTIGGFVAYMDHIGASDTLVYVAMKPLESTDFANDLCHANHSKGNKESSDVKNRAIKLSV